MIHLQNIADLLAASKDNKVYVILTERSEDSFQHLLLSVIDNDNNGNILSISFGNNRRDLAFAAHSTIIEKLGQNGYKVISGRVGNEIGLTTSFGFIFDSDGELLVDIQPYQEKEDFINVHDGENTAFKPKSLTVGLESAEDKFIGEFEINLKDTPKKPENMDTTNTESSGVAKEGIPEKRKRTAKDTK